MPSVATENVTIPRETVDQGIVALMAAEEFFQTLARGVHPPPWALFGEAITSLYIAAHGSFDDPADEYEFSPQYRELAERGRQEARDGWETTWADYTKTVAVIPVGQLAEEARR